MNVRREFKIESQYNVCWAQFNISRYNSDFSIGFWERDIADDISENICIWIIEIELNVSTKWREAIELRPCLIFWNGNRRLGWPQWC